MILRSSSILTFLCCIKPIRITSFCSIPPSFISKHSISIRTSNTPLLYTNNEISTETKTTQEKILHLLTTQYNLTSIPNIKQPSYWNQVIRHISDIPTSKYTNTEYAISILSYMKSYRIKASIFTYNSILNVMALEGNALQASSLLKSMDDGMEDAYPDIISYNTVINAWKKSGERDAVLQCEEILTHLLFNSTTTTTNNSKPLSRRKIPKVKLEVVPDVWSFNSVIDAWSKTNSEDACGRVEFWLQTMKDLYQETSDERFRPDGTTYASIIDTFARNGRVFDAEKVLKTVFENYKSNPTTEAKPDLRCFNAVLNAWASISHENREAAKRAETIVELMEETSKVPGYEDITPDKYAYNTLLKAYANSNQSSKAYKLLQRMITMKEYDTVSFNTVIDAYSKKQRYNQIQEQRADTISKAMGLWKQMHNLNVKGNVYTVTSLLNVFANSGEKDAARSAQEFLNSVEEKGVITPLTTTTYNAVMNAWAKSREFIAPQQIEKILTHMETLYETRQNIKAKPNTISYSILANAWARSRTNAFKAQEILDKVERMYKENEDESLKPNAHLYTTVINAWARSDEAYKAEKAYAILKRFEEFSSNYTSTSKNEKPNVYTYNAVLNACAYTYGDYQAKSTAFTIACTTFNEIRKVSKPNHVTYGTFLSVCAKLLSQQEKTERYPLIEAVFRKCCKDGMCGSLVLYSLKDATTPKLFRQCLMSKDVVGGRLAEVLDGDCRFVNVEDLPNKWTCKVRERL